MSEQSHQLSAEQRIQENLDQEQKSKGPWVLVASYRNWCKYESTKKCCSNGGYNL